MISDSLKEYICKHSKPVSPFLSKVTEETYKNIELPHMICGPLVGTMLNFLIKASSAKLVLDLGTFVGFSALSMAEALPEDGKVKTCENNAKLYEVAKKNIEGHPMGYKVEMFLQDAKEFIESIDEPIDLSFIDANKKDSILYYELLLKKTKPGGFIVIDDALWKGEVVQMSKPKHHIMDELNKHVLNDPRVENVLIPLRHGINIIYKLKS